MNHDTVWLKNGEIVKKFLTLAALWTWNSWLWWIKNPQPCATYNQFEYLIKEFCSDSDFRFLDRKQPLHVRKFNFDDVKGSFEVIWKADLLITAEIQGVKCKFLFSQFLVAWTLPYDESKWNYPKLLLLIIGFSFEKRGILCVSTWWLNLAVFLILLKLKITIKASWFSKTLLRRIKHFEFSRIIYFYEIELL